MLSLVFRQELAQQIIHVLILKRESADSPERGSVECGHQTLKKTLYFLMLIVCGRGYRKGSDPTDPLRERRKAI
jgi:hypothetical protein